MIVGGPHKVVAIGTIVGNKDVEGVVDVTWDVVWAKTTCCTVLELTVVGWM